MEILVPGFLDLAPVPQHELLDTSELDSSETTASLNADWIEPEFRGSLPSLNVHVRWLVPIARVEEEPVSSNPKNRRHAGIMPDSSTEAKGVPTPTVSAPEGSAGDTPGDSSIG